MNKKFIKQINSAFNAPPPTRKAAFLQSLNYPQTSRFDFIVGQIGYIRKRVWVISCLLAVATLFGLHRWTNDNRLNLIWIVSSVLPYISLVTITELARSTSYNMDELEICCKHNLADIVLARLGILSGFNLAIFTLIMLSFVSTIGIDVFHAGLYLFIPFLLTCSLSIFTLNRLRSREATYICGGISCFVGIANAIVFNESYIFYSDKYVPLGGIAFIALMLFAIKEAIKLIKKTEELPWSWS